MRREAREEAAERKEVPQLSWSEILSLIAAAYEVLLPFMLALAGLLVLLTFAFRWIFL